MMDSEHLRGSISRLEADNLEVLKAYGRIDTLVLLPTLVLPRFEWEETYSWTDRKSFCCSSPFARLEQGCFMCAHPVEYRAVSIGRIENRSPLVAVEDGVLYSADRSRIIYCFEQKVEFVVPDSVSIYPSKLHSAIFPSTLRKVGCEAFYHNSRLRMIVFQSKVEVEEAAFAKIPALRIIKKPLEMKLVENVFYADSRLDKYGFWD